MVDKITFMETLRAVQEVSRTSEKPLAREEIQGYFEGMDLSQEQQELIYQYLASAEGAQQGAKAGQEARDIAQQGAKAGQEPPYSPGSGKEAHSPLYQMYLSEVEGIPVLPGEQKQELYRRLLKGERDAAAEISNQWLGRITELAASYAAGKALLEDLVQEGNMGLLLGLEQILGQEGLEAELEHDGRLFEERLDGYAKEAMEQYRREVEGTDDSEHTILAKVSLLHEAQRILAEESGTIPTMQELSTYTKLPEEEIADIMALPKDAT